jgi:hypothetical protein
VGKELGLFLGKSNVLRAEESPVTNEMPLTFSKMNALIEIITQNSIIEDSVMEPYCSSELNAVHISEIAVGD